MVGDTRREDMFGNRPCKANSCRNRHLSHVVVFHASDYKPQTRWSGKKNADSKTTYIGFHTTVPGAAVSIVHTEFKPSSKGMLGRGVYFARSIADTIGKAQTAGGACIIAEIQMGKVFEFHKNEIYETGKGPNHNRELYEFVRSSAWWEEYDTCYMHHQDESKDEFCIKSPEKQIIKWIVVVDKDHDRKVTEYGLDTEFDSTKCYCI